MPTNTTRAAALANSCKWCGGPLLRGDMHPECAVADRAHFADARAERDAENRAWEDADHQADADQVAADRYAENENDPRDREPAPMWGAA